MTLDTSLLPWLEHSWRPLSGYIKQDRVPQALLITGAKGLGKNLLARHFAAVLLCQDRAGRDYFCKQCRSCRLIDSGTHPDLIDLSPAEDKSSISVEQIRAKLTETYLKPQFESYRAILIFPADAMTLSASNAFLKCLEEPPERTVFILVTANPAKLPITISSRCQKLDIKFPPHPVLVDWLNSRGLRQNQDTLINLFRYAGLQLDQMTDNRLLKQRAECFNDWMALAGKRTFPAIVSEKWKQVPEAQLINWILSWTTDSIKSINQTNTKWLCNLDFAEKFHALSENIDIKELFSLYSLVLKVRRELGSSLNFQIALEEILVKWSNVIRRN